MLDSSMRIFPDRTQTRPVIIPPHLSLEFSQSPKPCKPNSLSGAQPKEIQRLRFSNLAMAGDTSKPFFFFFFFFFDICNPVGKENPKPAFPNPVSMLDSSMRIFSDRTQTRPVIIPPHLFLEFFQSSPNSGAAKEILRFSNLAMAGDTSKPFFPVESSHHPKPPSRKPQTLTAESKFWRSFKNSELASGLILPVTALEFSPAPPHDLASASSAAVHLFDGTTLSPKPFSPLSSFSDVAYSPSFRCDGALLAAGGESGIVQVFRLDHAGHALRRLRAHARPVRLVRYPRVADKLHLFSGGDDALLSYWDVPSETQVLSFPGAHRDYIRAGSPSPISSEVIATGSYDHTVKVWDVRVSSNANPVLGFSHGAPVESVLFLPSGGLLATAGGNDVKIWDVIGGGRLVHTVEGHNKTVTAMCLGRVGNNESGGHGGGESRLMSVSLDGYLKIFDFAACKITHSMRYPAQLLSVGFSPSGLARVVGTSNGTIYMGKKKMMKEKEDHIFGAKVVNEFDTFAPEPEKHVLRPNFRYFNRGQNEKPLETDYMVKRAAKVKLAEYDKLLKEFRHKDALVAVLNRKNPNSIVAVMEELVARKKLLKTVVNLDTDELSLLLGFLHKYATMPRYARFLMGLAKRVVELRAEDIRSKDELRGYVRNLKRMIAEEIKIQHSLQEIQGMISPLLVIAGR